MKKKNIVTFSMLFFFSVIIGCAGTNTASWKSTDTRGLKGKTEAQILEKFGEPSQKSSDSNGIVVYEYRKPAERNSGLNGFIAVASYGINSGENSAYTDRLIIKFQKGRVINSIYRENVLMGAPWAP
jgi:hypothetical protein